MKEWRELFTQQEASGLSAVVFCREKDLCPKHFSVRRKQLGCRLGEVDTGFVRAVKRATDAHDMKAGLLVIHCHAGQLIFGTLPPFKGD